MAWKICAWESLGKNNLAHNLNRELNEFNEIFTKYSSYQRGVTIYEILKKLRKSSILIKRGHSSFLKSRISVKNRKKSMLPCTYNYQISRFIVTTKL